LEFRFPKDVYCINRYLHEVIYPPDTVGSGCEVTYGGGDLAKDHLIWQHGQKYRIIYEESFDACPYVNKTTLRATGYYSGGCNDISGSATVFSRQFRIAKITGISEVGGETMISCEGFTNEFRATDYYDYQVGDDVLVFKPGAYLTLPFTHSTSIKDDTNCIVIPAKFGDWGVYA
jgi:hypothetical protein